MDLALDPGHPDHWQNVHCTSSDKGPESLLMYMHAQTPTKDF